MSARKLAIPNRFMAKVDLLSASPCWLWLAHLDKSGYGMFLLNGQQTPAHRASYMLFKGSILSGLQIDHVCHSEALAEDTCSPGRCDHRRCVNPDHLEAVTHRVNVQRSRGAQTHCKHGHGYTPENTYIYRGTRVCRTCQRIAVDAYQEKNPRP